MAAVTIEKIERLIHPRVKPRLHVLRNLAHRVLLIAKPQQFGSRGCGPNRLFAFFAMVTVLHGICR